MANPSTYVGERAGDGCGKEREMNFSLETTELRWFEEFPGCSCGKPSRGILRGAQNQSYGHHCKKCAEQRLKASKKIREMEREKE